MLYKIGHLPNTFNCGTKGITQAKSLGSIFSWLVAGDNDERLTNPQFV